MALRKWLVRGLVLTLAGVIALTSFLYQQWTNPQAVRQHVLDKLSAQFVGAHVSLESAHMRLFGGISLNELRMTRRDDAEHTELLYVPSATIQIDKERLSDGIVALRKVELHKPRLHFIRNADGTWNLDGLLAPAPSTPLDEVIPMLVFQGAAIQIEDMQAPPGTPQLEIKDINLTVVNDPLPTIVFDGTGKADGIGAIHLRGTMQRESGAAVISLNLGQIRVGALVERLGTLNPEMVKHALQLDGTGSLQGTLEYRPQSKDPLRWDVNIGLSSGKFAHAKLPLALDQIEASVHVINREIPFAKLTAHSGFMNAKVVIEGFTPEALQNRDAKRPVKLEHLFQKLDVSLEHIPVTKEFFDLVPDAYKEIETDYQPRGPATMHYVFSRDDPAVGSRYCKITPENAYALVADFPYKYVDNVTGVIEFTSAKDKVDHLTLNLGGYASGQPVKVSGEIHGEYPNHEVKIGISGENIPLDDKLRAALPIEYVPIADSFHPKGLGNFVATIYRSPISHLFANRYVVKFHDCRVNYDVFPYPLEAVSGILDILPDKHFEFREFGGTHKGGEFHIVGRSYRLPNKRDEGRDRIEMMVTGNNFVLDRELREAVARSVEDPGMPRAWDAFDPRGRINFSGKVIVPAGKPGQRKSDIDLTVLPQGCRIKPTFFPYEMTDLYGDLHYSEGKVVVTDARARHGKSKLSLAKGTVLIQPGGGVTAKLEQIETKPLIPDPSLIAALPSVLRKGCETLQISDPLFLRWDMYARTSADPGKKPAIWWDGKISGKDITVHAGLTLEHVTGQVACRGAYDPDAFDGRNRDNAEWKRRYFLVGNLHLDSATLFKKEQFQNITVSPFFATNGDPEVLQVEGLMAEFCRGKVYGPMRIEFGPAIRYSTKLTASDIDVREFARLNFDQPDDVSGKATLRLYLDGKGSEPENIKGKGILEVPNAKLYNLPPFIGLLKFLGLRLPDRTAFDEAYAAFDIEGGRLQFTQLKALGDAFSLEGKGDMKLDGTDLDMEFNVGWARMAQALPGFNYFQTALSKQLFKLKVRGEVGKVSYTKEPIPVILDPLKGLLKRQP